MGDAGNDAEGLTLLGLQVSPFTLRARMALNLKGLSYDYIEQDLFHKSELLRTFNPVHNKVPVLIHDGRPICESLVVVEYVDEVWPGTGAAAILPADPYGRAVARFWAAYNDDKLFPAYAGVLSAATEEERAEKVMETHAAVLNLEKAFAEITSSNGGGGGKDGAAAPAFFFGGDSVGYLDLALGCSLPWFGALRAMFGVEVIDAAQAPLLAVWAERFAETKVARELLPEPDEAVAYYAKKVACAAAKN